MCVVCRCVYAHQYGLPEAGSRASFQYGMLRAAAEEPLVRDVVEGAMPRSVYYDGQRREERRRIGREGGRGVGEAEGLVGVDGLICDVEMYRWEACSGSGGLQRLTWYVTTQTAHSSSGRRARNKQEHLWHTVQQSKPQKHLHVYLSRFTSVTAASEALSAMPPAPQVSPPRRIAGKTGGGTNVVDKDKGGGASLGCVDVRRRDLYADLLQDVFRCAGSEKPAPAAAV